MRCWTLLFIPSGILIRTQHGMAAALRLLKWHGAASCCLTGCPNWRPSWPQHCSMTSGAARTGKA